MSAPEQRSGMLKLVPGGLPAPAEYGAGHAAQWSRGRLRTLVIASGRGGVGKSNLAANLAVALGQRGARVVLVDADLTQANLDLLLGVHPRWDLGHVLAGEKSLDEVVVTGPENVTLVPGVSNPPAVELDDFRREQLLRSLGTAGRGRRPDDRGHGLEHRPRHARAVPRRARAAGRGHARHGVVLGRLRAREDAAEGGRAVARARPRREPRHHAGGSRRRRPPDDAVRPPLPCGSRCTCWARCRSTPP
jgi:hypothetical protein